MEFHVNVSDVVLCRVKVFEKVKYFYSITDPDAKILHTAETEQ